MPRQYTIKLIPATNKSKTVNLSTLLRGEVFERRGSYGVFMVTDSYRNDSHITAINLQTGQQLPVPKSELVYPVKATLNYHRIQGD